MTTPDDNPFRAPQLSFEPAETKFERILRRLRICLGLQCAIIVFGVAAAFYNIYSIVVTGAILSLVGILTAFFSRRSTLTYGWIFGLSGPAISSACFVLIHLLDWGPTDAQHPVSIIAVVYTTFALPLGLYAWTKTGSDNLVTELENSFDAALVTDDVQHETKNTG